MTSSETTPNPENQQTQEELAAPSSAATTHPSKQPLSWRYYGVVALLVLGIVGATFAIGQKAGWSQIGGGGVNARLLPKVGDKAPDLFTVSADGQYVLLSSLRGQPVWINFWGSWCEPCQAEMPAIEAAYRELQPQGLVMLGISQKEDISQSVAYANAAGATFPILADPALLLANIDIDTVPEEIRQTVKDTKSWQVNNQPTHVFIDRNGIVRAVVMSPMTTEQAVAYGEQILGIPYDGPPLGPASPIATPAISPQATANA